MIPVVKMHKEKSNMFFSILRDLSWVQTNENLEVLELLGVRNMPVEL